MKKLLILTMLWTLTAAWNPAVATKIDFWFDVGGIDVTSENADNIKGVTIEGKVSFDVNTLTLTLENVNIHVTDNHGIQVNVAYSQYNGTGDHLTIKLIGKNTITIDRTNENSYYGIYCWGKTKIEGPGSLETEEVIYTQTGP